MKFKGEKLFEFIRKKVPKNGSLVEVVSDVLDISYDSAYRRINNKTTLSFEEALTLTDYYQIPIYSLYNIATDKSLFVFKSNYTNSYEGLEDFYNNVTQSIEMFSKLESSDLLYAAKDIPVYYTTGKSLFEKFKLYVFLNILSDSSKTNLIPFKDFNPKISMVKAASNFKKAFKNIKITEVWNDTTINSSLYQIYYFYEIRLIGKEDALALCNEVEEIIKEIENQSSLEIWNKEKGISYRLYYNRLINLNNTVYMRSKKMKTLLVTYTSLSHIRIEDEKTCAEIESYFKKQLQYSKRISGSSEVDRKMFFTSMLDKIEQLREQIKAKSSISFM